MATLEPVTEPQGLLVKTWGSCRNARPTIQIELDTYVAYVQARRPRDIALSALCLEDLYLACACAQQLAPALDAFEREIMPAARAVLAQWPAANVDDTRQQLRVMFLVDCAGRGPLISTYTGRGALRAWVRVISSREAGRTTKVEDARVANEEDLFDALLPGTGPELASIKVEAARAFRSAFVDAVRHLDSRARTLLRLHLLDELTIDQIAPMYGAHRATIARWIAAAKHDVTRATHRRLTQELRLSREELESLIRLTLSQIELSDGLLQSPAARVE